MEHCGRQQQITIQKRIVFCKVITVSCHTDGMLKKTFAPLKKCNVYMISQGASFVNISFVVDREELNDVVNQLHYHLFENPDAEVM